VKCKFCHKATTKVTETREAFGGVVLRRNRACACGASQTTYEISAEMWAAARHDIQKRIKARPYHEARAKRAELVQVMRERRHAGADCPTLAAEFGLSVDMVRYYTRMPRERLYPGAKRGREAVRP
jgi:transcriptional regulator NrdR family protein